MITKANLLKIGSFAKPHGVAGEIVLRLSPEWSGYEPEPDFIFVELQGGLVPFEVTSLRFKNEMDLLVGIDRVDAEEMARTLQGCEVYIEPEALGQLADDESPGLNALIGFLVADINHGTLGKIVAVHAIHNNPLLELEYKGKEVLIPFNEDFIVSMDGEKNEIQLDTPEGLIDLFLE